MSFIGQNPLKRYMDLYKNETIFQGHLVQERDAVPRAATISVKYKLLIDFV